MKPPSTPSQLELYQAEARLPELATSEMGLSGQSEAPVSQGGYGSWLCENAKTLNRDRRSYSSKTALGLQFESAFNLEIELKNVILVAFRLFEFLHSKGQNRTHGVLHMRRE